jgi:DUF1680 family protein
VRKYRRVDFTKVELHGSFWRERVETVLTRTIPSQYQRLEESGILDSLSLPKPVPPIRIPRNMHGFTTQIFWDSDVGKWIEAASYALSLRRDAAIEQRIDAIVETLEKAQAADGYLNCWYLEREPENRWTNLRDNHELYNAGHLLEGAIAYFQATRRRRFLDIMERYVAHIRATFGTGPGQKPGYPGHQEIELALVKLYHLTGERKHLDLAAYFINQRGTQPHYFDLERAARGEPRDLFVQRTFEYNQSHLPVREQHKVVGHAVRAMYMYTAMADLAAELGDVGLRRACEALWRDITETRMYLTGGFGPSASNEGFTADYDLPNETAYAETCASVAMIFWAQRMLHLDLDGRYADVLEQALYNNALAGLSRDGEHYFYDNKLDSDGSHKRWTWHPCPCCTMNVARLVASVSGYFYSVGDDVFAVHLYGGATTCVEVGGTEVTVDERSNYPWEGDISLAIAPRSPASFTLKLRIPGWAAGATATVNGEAIDVAAGTENGYLAIRRRWQAGDRVRLNLPMPPERVYAHPRVNADQNRVALRRGPLVYCAEQVDNEADPHLLRLPRSSALADERRDLFDGIVALTASGAMVDATRWGGALYGRAPAEAKGTTITAVPYFLWCNRGSNPMQVWLAETA